MILKWTVLLCVVCDLKMLIIVRCVYNEFGHCHQQSVIKSTVLQLVELVPYPLIHTAY